MTGTARIRAIKIALKMTARPSTNFTTNSRMAPAYSCIRVDSWTATAAFSTSQSNPAASQSATTHEAGIR